MKERETVRQYQGNAAIEPSPLSLMFLAIGIPELAENVEFENTISRQTDSLVNKLENCTCEILLR